MHLAVNGRGGGHRLGEDVLPLGEDQQLSWPSSGDSRLIPGLPAFQDAVENGE